MHEGHGSALLPRYGRAFPVSYAETFPVARALEDIARIERLGPDRPVAIDFHRAGDGSPNKLRAAVYRFDAPIPLSERVPILENLGFRVIDERSYRVRPLLEGQPREVALHDMALETAASIPIDPLPSDRRLEACFLAVMNGAAENDSFNGLVLAAGVDWRDAAVFRAYAAYLRQIRSPFGPRYIAETLLRHAGMARDLIELFSARFHPDRLTRANDRAGAQAAITERFLGALDGVPSLDEDRIHRQLLGLVQATVRTNFFQRDASGAAPPAIAFKFDCGLVSALPAPVPFREIWVASSEVEGVHLRFGRVARGGLRWSDRPQDFRSEVLGLAHAQNVKNAVIVPEGAKGGFVPKRLPRGGSREAVQGAGITAYRSFVSVLLDLTDNLIDGRIVSPDRVVCHDGGDPYLVAAADKGTATFSGLANTLAAERGFWLGDAFASGGATGYDHKEMAITARGVWACVKRHFREMGRDTAREPFTVAGVGDMSGDVFGNGMLLEPGTRLIAAFDHRDVFLDPNTDPAASFSERKRLFGLPRSSWQDYDRSKLSAGGGVFSRSLKSVPVSPEVAAVLGIAAEALMPAALIRAILTAPVDLLWFGGIGTYIRASSEPDDRVNDRANDALRVTAAEVKAKVFGEGANLAVTQRGRIELASRGVRLNTDFIDNSAGVNSSDIEVNIKIALAPPVAAGRLDSQRRADLLADMTGDVAALCLANNYNQSLALSLAERRGVRDLDALSRLIEMLESRGLVDRALEALPSPAEIEGRRAKGLGLTRPELAVLLSYAKMAISSDLLASGAPDDPALAELLTAYFPPVLRETYAEGIANHGLRRDIIATALTNAIVNRCGPAFPFSAAEETGRSVTAIALAFFAADRAFAFDVLWRAVDALDGRIAASQQLSAYAEVQGLLERRTRWFAREGLGSHGLAEAIRLHGEVFTRLAASLPEGVADSDAARFQANLERGRSMGFPAETSRTLAAHAILAWSSDAALLVENERPEAAVRMGRFLSEISEALGLGALFAKAETFAPADRYDRLAVTQALGSLSASQRRLVRTRDGAGAAAFARKNEARALRECIDSIANDELTASRLAFAAAEIARFAEGDQTSSGRSSLS